MKSAQIAAAQYALEEGEIVSDVEEATATAAAESALKDDDCICIEPVVEEIIIDDDTPCSSHLSSEYVSVVQSLKNEKHSKLLTSTPLNAEPALSNVGEWSDKPILFYEDTSRYAWFDTINSEDTFADYTKGAPMLRPKRLRRSRPKPKHAKSNATASEDVIVLDDTKDETLKQTVEESEEIDDSVIFVGKTTQDPAPPMDFIPLVSDMVPNPIAMVPEVRTPRKQRAPKPLFTTSEKKELNAYNINTYNPNADAEETLPKKRLIIVDGSNVAFKHGLFKEFSVKGLKICIDYFEKMGHEVKAVVPQFRLHKCSDPEEMEKLHDAGKIVLTPCKNLPGKFTASYDDRFILQLAAEIDSVIVSNDNYRDLVNENAAFKKLIENRVVGFTWCNDIFMVAKDPYGQWGPPLQAILNRP